MQTMVHRSHQQFWKNVLHRIPETMSSRFLHTSMQNPLKTLLVMTSVVMVALPESGVKHWRHHDLKRKLTLTSLFTESLLHHCWLSSQTRENGITLASLHSPCSYMFTLSQTRENGTILASLHSPCSYTMIKCSCFIFLLQIIRHTPALNGTLLTAISYAYKWPSSWKWHRKSFVAE